MRLRTTIAIISIAAMTTACSLLDWGSEPPPTIEGDGSVNAFARCIEHLKGTAAYVIVNKRSMQGARPTLDQLSDTSTVSDEEIAALYQLKTPIDICRQEFLASLTGVSLDHKPAYIDFWSNDDKDMVELVQKKITWGEFNLRKIDNIDAWQRQFTNSLLLTVHP